MYLQKLTTLNANLRLFALLGILSYITYIAYFRPSTNETEEMLKLFDAGMAAARLNL